MGTYKNKAYTLRIDNELMEKIRKIAKVEDRKINQQIERMLKKAVTDYESQNGSINIEINESTVMNNNINIGK